MVRPDSARVRETTPSVMHCQVMTKGVSRFAYGDHSRCFVLSFSVVLGPVCCVATAHATLADASVLRVLSFCRGSRYFVPREKVCRSSPAYVEGNDRGLVCSDGQSPFSQGARRAVRGKFLHHLSLTRPAVCFVRVLTVSYACTCFG